MNECPKIIIIMGVSGSGKSTIGKALAESLAWQFKDADDYHSLANKEKMNRGISLTDKDRSPWLKLLRKEIEIWIALENPTVLACSSLKSSYRRVLSCDLPTVRFVYLKASKESLKTRLASRVHEFMNSSLLESQFETLEEPEDAITINADSSIKDVICSIKQQIGRK